MAARIVAMALGWALLVLGGLATTAAASTAPECFAAETWDRLGLERPHQLDCHRAWSAELSRGPAHGRLTGFAFDAGAQAASWRYRPDGDAPAADSLDLRLEGPGGTTTQRVAIHVTPLAQNTAPQCQPASAAQRTAGTAPAVVTVDLYCWDYENDGFVVDGGGPGAHLDGPEAVRGGDGGGAEVPVWHYRTATASGQEATTFWATDDLGARSADTPLSVEVGPAVDRLPACLPAPGAADPGADVLPVYARPGATRRFGVVCSDADHDPMAVRLGAAPARGALTTWTPAALEDHDWGTERWVDAVYRPADGSGEADPFSVVAAAHGRTTETKMAIENADEPRWFNGLGCASDTARTTAGAPGVIRLSCADDDGDPLQATVMRPPAHGVASPPVLAPARYGWDDVAVAWTPEPGFVGIDSVGLRVADGHGVQLDLDVDLYVYAADTSAAAPSLPASGQPSVGQAPAIAPIDQARRALDTRDVVLVRKLGDGRVFARRAAGLLRASGGVAFALAARIPAGRAGRGTVRLRLMP